MRKIILFIASSLDGYIAGANGDIGWLFSDADYNYSPFFDSIDTTLMGYRTFEKMLEFEGEFHYKGKKNYVFTHNASNKEHPYVQFVEGDPVAFTKDLQQKEGKDIFLVGGGQVNTLLLNAGLIDRVIISIHPSIVGKGIRLFAGEAAYTEFTTQKVQTFESGLIQITLDRKEA